MKLLKVRVVFLFGLVKSVQNNSILASQVQIITKTQWKMPEPFSNTSYSHVDCEVLKKILGPMREEIIRDWRKLLNEEENDLDSSLNVTIKSKTMS